MYIRKIQKKKKNQQLPLSKYINDCEKNNNILNAELL